MIRNVIKSLLEAKAYPDPTTEVRLVETHVSFIFLTDRFVYKVKKAVNYGFLDFTTLDRRRFYCNEEVRLNRRLCPEVYLGVVELRDTTDGPGFGGTGPVIDYAVKMRRLPQERMLDRLLAEENVEARDMTRIAQAVARFHEGAERGPVIDAYGETEAIRENWEQNFRQAASFVGLTISAAQMTEIRQWVISFLQENDALFRERVTGGFIRDCDGDLHSGNICLTDPVCIFDCIEFNDKFRYIDTAADLAFLLMDLEYADRKDLAGELLNAYQAASGDVGMAPLLDFYKAQRAFVRGKVTSLRLEHASLTEAERIEVKDTAVRYFRLARGYSLRARMHPMLVLTCGMIGSGKSTLARALSRELGFALKRSDVVRKELAGVATVGAAPTRSYRAGIYNSDMDQATYLALLTEAERSLSRGEGMVVDATFRRSADRERFRELALRLGVPFLLVETRCSEEVARLRLEARNGDAAEVSDARWEHYRQLEAEFEAPQPGEAIVVDSALPVHQGVDLVIEAAGLPS
ncbi:bifunctional aminoglycoside phosphotransferase/ATP-binding protein [Geomonas ferrireducens]|uniref:bifunctional aminoglycoside phosphotransferase/ATP-binding protein n=1 Tax=Geomonas ferrireducens TaxID=2570227 RepID=UPI0010A7B788|nr:bifunctional aminoglycoside phosphotransferase/ATP-binding protein [Geomonas ferrireducens]